MILTGFSRLILKSSSLLLFGLCASFAHAQAAEAPQHQPKFRVVAIAEKGGGDHQRFVDAAKIYLARLGAENDFTVDYISTTDPINDAFLAKYQLFIQLNYPPWRWTPTAQKAFENYIEKGKGGWIGFHHAGLIGDFDGYPMSPWFSEFLGASGTPATCRILPRPQCE